MKILYAGTPEFAVPSLRMLLNSGHEIVGVYTQPDRPSGRGRKAAPGPVKSLALAHGLPVLQPESLKSPEEQDKMRALGADLLAVAAYGLILPKAALDMPRLGSVNVHASLLPRWRGAAPIQRAILAGDRETGITIMFIEPKLDSGPMLLKAATPIAPLETAGELHDRLALLGAEALRQCLPGLEARSLQGEIQDESLTTCAPKLDKSEAALDWTRSAAELERQVRAFNPWPVAETACRGAVLRVWRAQALEETAAGAPGEALDTGSKTLDIATGDGVLRLLEVQAPGGKRLSAADFLNGRNLRGVRLGSDA
jgi:methionyl-tRNA formyltransferase